jgi:hypothetical protein
MSHDTPGAVAGAAWEDGRMTDGEGTGRGPGEGRAAPPDGGPGGSGADGRLVVRVSPRAAVARDGDALVVAQLDRSTLRRLEGTAAELWARLDGVAAVDDLVDASLRDHPGADPAAVREQVSAFVAQLVAEGLVERAERA